MPEDDIPEFELGEPEEAVPANAAASSGNEGDRVVRQRSLSGDDSQKGEKHVVVPGANEGGRDGDADDRLTPQQYKEKSRQFEERRKKHYEMKDVKDLLAYDEPFSIFHYEMFPR